VSEVLKRLERTRQQYLEAAAHQLVRAAISNAALEERVVALANRQPELIRSIDRLRRVLTVASGNENPIAISLGLGVDGAKYTMAPRISGSVLHGFDFVVTNSDTTSLVLEQRDFDLEEVQSMEPANVLPDLPVLEVAEAAYARSEQMLCEAWEGVNNPALNNVLFDIARELEQT
jgi:hypothetical protein